MSVFDNLLTCVQAEDTETYATEEDAKQALLAVIKGNPFDALQPVPQRITTPQYEHAPVVYEKSAPLPFEYKADVNKRQGIIEAYLTVWNDPNTGQPFIDPYKDIVLRTAFDASVKELEQARRYKNSEYLVPDLWQHKRDEQIGGIKAFTKDSKGLIYVAQLVTSIPRARYALDLASQKMLGSSFGYDPVDFDYMGDIRNLTAFRLHEISQVTFSTNPYADVLDVKSMRSSDRSRFYVPSPYQVKMPVDRQAIKTNLKKATSLFDDLLSQGINSYEQWKWENH